METVVVVEVRARKRMETRSYRYLDHVAVAATSSAGVFVLYGIAIRQDERRFSVHLIDERQVKRCGSDSMIQWCSQSSLPVLFFCEPLAMPISTQWGYK